MGEFFPFVSGVVTFAGTSMSRAWATVRFLVSFRGGLALGIP